MWICNKCENIQSANAWIDEISRRNTEQGITMSVNDIKLLYPKPKCIECEADAMKPLVIDNLSTEELARVKKLVQVKSKKAFDSAINMYEKGVRNKSIQRKKKWWQVWKSQK